MHFGKRVISVLVLAVLTSALYLFGAGYFKTSVQAGRTVLPGIGKETIYFWYMDESMTSYVNGAAVSFGQENGVRVIPVLAGAESYLEAINDATLRSDQLPDCYLISNDMLEKAYLAGLATETADGGTVCNTANFPQAALHAVSYHGQNIAYPLYFDTSVLLYNKDYLELWKAQQEDEALVRDALVEDAPPTLDALLQIANTFDVPEGVEGVMEWDVSDIFYNYWIVGHYLNMGGASGDDKTDISIDNEEAVLCLQTYKALNQFFSMETDTITYDSVLQDFIDGRIMFTIVSSDALGRLQAAEEDGTLHFAYAMAKMPDVSEELQSGALSATGAVAVNGYSKHKELANAFAAYLTDTCAEDLYERSGKLPARNGTDADHEMIQVFRAQYADSVSLPKMMETGNFWLQMEVLFTKIWNGADVQTQVSHLAEQIGSQLHE
ncbi:MAG: extracellular solute-binding protein [Lachnospiraceae bacterium]|nr:extracellular solute-binding protein [Lachnospiraceae bacterium]